VTAQVIIASAVYPYFYCVGRQKRKNSCPQTFVPVEVIEAEAVGYWQRHVRLDE
jgi:hypothetical protein